MITKEEILARARVLKDDAACKGTHEKLTDELRSFLNLYAASRVSELPTKAYPLLMRLFEAWEKEDAIARAVGPIKMTKTIVPGNYYPMIVTGHKIAEKKVTLTVLYSDFSAAQLRALISSLQQIADFLEGEDL